MEQTTRSSSSLIAEFGNGKVFSDPQTLRFYSSSITGSGCIPLAVVFPENEEDVVRLVLLANQLNLTLYPISRGKNMGYGDAQATSAGQVIVDLRNMNAIKEVNEELCYATIQPGVSQGQLYTYISSNKLHVQLDVTGAGLDASIVGNMLERGFGHTEYGDRYARIIHLRAILADGSLIKTGLAAYGNADASNTYRYGIGPSIEGLFTQSNFGIITEVTFELMPKPELTYTFAGSIRSVGDLSALIETIREAKLKGVLNSAVHIANKSRTVGKGDSKLIGSWNVSGCISGPSALVKTKSSLLKKIFRKHLSGYLLLFIGPWRMKLMKFIHEKIFQIPVYRPLYEVFQQQNGIPTDDPLKTLLDDEKATSAGLSISEYPSCFSWINAVCSARGESVLKLVSLLESIFLKAGYELRITMTFVNSRTLILITNITYPRTESEIERAEKFVKDCHHELNRNGFLPYRSGSGMYDSLPEPEDGNKKLLQKLHSALDPKNRFAPGKYQI